MIFALMNESLKCKVLQQSFTPHAVDKRQVYFIREKKKKKLQQLQVEMCAADFLFKVYGFLFSLSSTHQSSQ